MKEFERNLTDMVSTFVENIQEMTAKCRELETQHHERLMEICVRLLDKVVKTELNDELTEELQEVEQLSLQKSDVFANYCIRDDMCVLEIFAQLN